MYYKFCTLNISLSFTLSNFSQYAKNNRKTMQKRAYRKDRFSDSFSDSFWTFCFIANINKIKVQHNTVWKSSKFY